MHAALSAVHCCAPHLLFTHAFVQHSVPAVHAVSAGLHPVFTPHAFGPPSASPTQLPLQHSVSAAQETACGLHASAPSVLPSLPPSFVGLVPIGPSAEPSASDVTGTSVSSLPQPVARTCEARMAKAPATAGKTSFFMAEIIAHSAADHQTTAAVGAEVGRRP